MSMMRDVIRTSVALALLVTVYVASQLFTPTTNFSTEVEVLIERGMSFREAVRLLEREKLIRDAGLFNVMARVTGLPKRLRPGLYVFSGRHNQWSVFRAINRGRVKIWTVTIAPGENLDVIEKKISSTGLVNATEFRTLVRDEAFMRTLGVNSVSLEGYLYPETYNFSRGISAREMLSQMVRRTRAVTAPLMESARALGLDEDRLLTMASIIEKEAYLSSEASTISAVYHNRLRMGMRLQADPTVVYGIKPQSEGITRSDLKRETPYNTYVIKGLPLGPIASPGRVAMEAAVDPEDVPYIYFVSNNDGSHVFSSSLKEHERAVRAYRARKGGRDGDG